MKTIKLSVLTMLVVFFAACGNNQPEQAEKVEDSNSSYIALDKLDVDALDAEIIKRREAIENDTVADKYKSAALLEAYEMYGTNFPNHSKAADYLFRAGELAMNLNHTAQSIKLFSKVYSDYKDYDKRPYALFMRAFVLENQAYNYTEAQLYYKEFLEKFPDHPMADDAEYSLKNLGKSPEQLIREFEIQDSINAAQKAS